MTDYISLLETNVSIDSPESQILNQALRDNILAINEGAAGAPSLHSNAFLGHVESDGEAAGAFVIFSDSATTSGNPSYTWLRTGGVRMSISGSATEYTGAVAGEISVNGVVVLTTSYVDYPSSFSGSVDLDLTQSDIVSFKALGNVTGNSTEDPQVFSFGMSVGVDINSTLHRAHGRIGINSGSTGYKNE